VDVIREHCGGDRGSMNGARMGGNLRGGSREDGRRYGGRVPVE
jgi:hypothetical protein